MQQRLFFVVHLLTLLARHRRIHEAHQDGQPPAGNEDDYENEDNELGPGGHSSAAHSVPHTMVNVNSVTSMPSMNMPSAMSTMMGPQMIAPQLLQQQI